MFVGVADSMMVGRLGAAPLAASSISNVIFTILMSLGIGITFAMTPLVAKADGESNPDDISEALKHGTVINVVSATILFLLLLAANQLLPYLDQPEEVVVLAAPYLLIISLSIIPLLVFQNYRQFAEGLSLTKQAMQISITGNVINVGLNYILIFGKFGFEPMGLIGAGYATLISRILMAALMAGYIYFMPRFEAYRTGFSFRHFKKLLFNKMLRIGIPAGFQFIFEVGAFGFGAIMMGWIGVKELAAHQIAINLAALTYMAASGLSAAAAIRVGNQVGLKDRSMLRDITFSIYLMVIIFMSVFAILFILTRNQLPLLYIDDPEVVAIAGSLLIVAGLFQLSDGVQVVGLGALRGMSDTRVPTYITFAAYWILGIPISYVLGFYTSLAGVGIWIGFFLGLSFAAVALIIRFNRMSKTVAL